MANITTNDLMLAVLSMAAYADDPYAQLGDASLLKVRPDGAFFAVAYNYDGTAVISYRGTDNASWNAYASELR